MRSILNDRAAIAHRRTGNRPRAQKNSVTIVSHDRADRSRIIDGQRMFVRRKTNPARRPSRSSVSERRARAKAPLDAAGLLLELDMAALIRDAEGSLRQHRDEQRGPRAWWRRLFGKRQHFS